MKLLTLSSITMVAALLTVAPALAQSTTQKHTQSVSKQHTDGDSPTIVGPGSKAYKQQTQSLSHAQPPSGAVKQN